MAEETNTTSRARVTRQDRAVTDDAWIAGFLRQAGMATIATVEGEQPFQTTLLFVLAEDQHAIYFHHARHGRAWENLLKNQRVCLTAATMGRLLPAKTAFNFSVEYESVVVFGNAHLIENNEEAGRALQLLLDKYFPHLRPGEDYRPTIEAELKITAVYRMDIEEWSGKKKAAEEDFPGAFYWGDRPQG